MVSPKGKTIIVEKQSGAIVGNSLAEVREDINGGDIRDMKEQVRIACVELKKVQIISEEDFWARYDK